MLEFGVPADSADLYYDKDEVEIDEITQPYILPFNRRFNWKINYEQRTIFERLRACTPRISDRTTMATFPIDCTRVAGGSFDNFD